MTEQNKFSDKIAQSGLFGSLFHTDPLARYTAWLALSTFFLFLATVFNVMILWWTDQTLRDTLIAANRAWVQVQLDRSNTAESGNEIAQMNFKIAYKNVGREPALASISGGAFQPI